MGALGRAVSGGAKEGSGRLPPRARTPHPLRPTSGGRTSHTRPQPRSKVEPASTKHQAETPENTGPDRTETQALKNKARRREKGPSSALRASAVAPGAGPRSRGRTRRRRFRHPSPEASRGSTASRTFWGARTVFCSTSHSTSGCYTATAGPSSRFCTCRSRWTSWSAERWPAARGGRGCRSPGA